MIVCRFVCLRSLQVFLLAGSLLMLGACSSGSEAPSAPLSAEAPGAFAGPPASNPSSPDPQLDRQWHLDATALNLPYDLALRSLSERGRGQSIALIDGTVNANHPDLGGQLTEASQICCNWAALSPGSAAGNSSNPAADQNMLNDLGHATGLAVLIAGRENNGFGGRGIASQARLISFNAIAIGNDSLLVQAMRAAVGSKATVINHSWSPPDPGQGGSRSFYPAPAAWFDALDSAQAQGRSGLGAIVVKAAGNGAAYWSPSRWRSDSGDQANYDGFSQHPLVITVGAVDAFARPLASSEPGAQVLISAFSSQANTPAVDNGTERLPEGSSTATAMISAVAALMLEARPSLTWRDVRWILASTARPVPGHDQPGLSSANSSLRAHGFHQQVGYGLVDAKAAVDMARSFQGLPPQKTCSATAAPAPSAPAWSLPLALQSCAVQRIESVVLTLATSHEDASGLRISLISPSGQGVQLSAPRDCNSSVCGNLKQGFQFHSVRFMAEAAAGLWSVQIKQEDAKPMGEIMQLQLRVLGH
ncbi:MAG: hypothetical protein EB091_10295 [Betaproteobacteria bacterium]|nr:hypothetical protein [Betaproteobacteria bacterium]NDB41260.1 hypothetical protein [Betaproteobacteria bacterium]NDC98577.1 hypothetical protein [Betaproteobacteria bacterium]NDD76208.1 hypothetical protein [Betaproteobacteria bacterium]NDF77107.1 hypothetical protein [Betaproteobacteria bacterium]